MFVNPLIRAGVAACALGAALPSAALATTVRDGGDGRAEVIFDRALSITVTQPSPDTVLVTDAAGALTAGSGCTQAGERAVRCGTRGVRVRPFSTSVAAPARVTIVGVRPIGNSGGDIDTGLGDDVVDLSQALKPNVSTGPGADEAIGDAWDVDTSGGDDTVTGSSGADVIRLGAGDDRVEPTVDHPAPLQVTGPEIADTVHAGAGVDTLSFGRRTRGVSASMLVNPNNGVSQGSATTTGIQGSDVSFTEVENLVGSSANDTLTGDDRDNTILGGAGRDVIDGRGGDDQLSDHLTVVLPSSQGTVLDPQTGRPREQLKLPPTRDDKTNAAGGERVQGGPGADVINISGDGLEDEADCGTDAPGSLQRVTIGGRQAFIFTPSRGDKVFKDPVDEVVGCEDVQSQAKDERGSVRLKPLAGRAVAGRTLRVRLSCPKQSTVACDGAVRAGSATAVRYRLARGASKTVTVRIPARVMRGKALLLVATERGKTKPRTVSLRLA